VIRAVSDHYGLQRRDRHAKVTQARQVAYFLCYELTGCTFAQIGRTMKKSRLTTREGYEAAFRLANQYPHGFGAD
jgi:chromosomal replication initiation ATPase DnaA